MCALVLMGVLWHLSQNLSLLSIPRLNSNPVKLRRTTAVRIACECRRFLDLLFHHVHLNLFHGSC